jgi:dTDP-glucose 4,6-dehydratase
MHTGQSRRQRELVETSMSKVFCHLAPGLFDRQRIFITGGTGFFGTWLLEALAMAQASGQRIEVWILSRNPSAFLQKYPRFSREPWLHFLSGDIQDTNLPDLSIDFLIHAATETSADAHKNHLAMLDTIINGTRNILSFSVRSSVKRALLISSGGVYGQTPAGQTSIPEDARYACHTKQPLSAYGEGKRVMELLGTLYQERFGIETLTARCFAFSGPPLPIDGHFAIGNFVRDALFRDEIVVSGDGKDFRSYLYGADLAIWLLTILASGDSGIIYHVGSDELVSIEELAKLVQRTLAPNKEVIVKSEVTSKIQNHYVPEIKVPRRELGLDVWTTLADSINVMGEYALAHERKIHGRHTSVARTPYP